MDYRNSLSASRFYKAKAEKKALKRLSNTFTVPLILMQVIGTVAALSALVIAILFRIGVLHDAGCFNYKFINDFVNQSSNSDYINNIFFGLIYFAYVFIPFVIIAALLRQNPLKVIPAKVKHPELIFPAIVFGFFFYFAGDFYTKYFEWLLGIFNLQTRLSQFSFPNNPRALVFYFIQISVLAPICEEAIFRGMILQNLRKYGNFFAVLVSSLMFGVLHGNFEQTPFAFIVGLILGFVVIETGSIFISMLLHCCINSASIILTAIAYYHGDDLSNMVSLIFMAVIIVLTVIVFIFLKNKHFFTGIKKRYFPEETPVALTVKTFIATPGFIIYTSIYVAIMFFLLRQI